MIFSFSTKVCCIIGLFLLLTKAWCTEADLEEVTIAQTLNVEAWISNEVAIEETLYGEWKIEGGTQVSILRLPISSNTCLITLDNRLVPAFLLIHDGNHYVVAADEASEDLRLKPRVFKYEIVNSNAINVIEVVLQEYDRSFVNSSELSQLLSETCVESDTNLNKLELVRI